MKSNLGFTVVSFTILLFGIPGGIMSPGNGYEATEAFHSNARQQLLELIRQIYL